MILVDFLICKRNRANWKASRNWWTKWTKHQKD